MSAGFLSRSRSVAGPGFNRWLVPPAALCIHLCIGQAYAFSVFNLPMSKLIGITQSAPDDWKLTDLGWIFSIAIFVLGFSAAIFGPAPSSSVGRAACCGWPLAAATRCAHTRSATPATSSGLLPA